MAAPARVAIVGSGPAGFYAAEALLRALEDCHVDMFERLAAPHGLVRYGVAPDHQKLKQVSLVFDRIADDPRFEFHGLVEVGRDVSVAELLGRYHAVIVSTGQSEDRRLGVSGESLGQVFGSALFVGWYNGHPNHSGLRPDLAVSSAAIVGNGNVALDVCRMLVRDMADLRASDIPEPMQPAFAARGIRTVHVIGRSGVTATKFSFKEFRELVELPGVRVAVPQAAQWPAAAWVPPKDEDAARVAGWLRQHAPANDRSGCVDINFWFHAAPSAFIGSGRVQQVAIRASPGSADRFVDAPARLECGLAVTCVGYRHRPLPGIPADDASGAIRHTQGQVVDAGGREVPGLFVTGWAKRGPNGVIGTNRADSYETAATVLARLPALQTRPDARSLPPLSALLAGRGVAPLSYAQWRLLDGHERRRGAALGKPREKLLGARAALAALNIDEHAH